MKYVKTSEELRREEKEKVLRKVCLINKNRKCLSQKTDKKFNNEFLTMIES